MPAKLLKTNWVKFNRPLFPAVLILIAALVLYLPSYSRFKKLKEQNEQLDRKISALKKEIDQLKNINQRLGKDEFILEKLARDNLGVAKDNEIVVDIGGR